MPRSLVAVLALLAAMSFTAAAHADGGPAAGIDAGPAGVTAPGSGSRYVTLPTRGGTLLAQIRRDGGQIDRWRVLDRSLVIPAVAYDGSATGLSADGRTLVLATPRGGYARRRSGFVVLDARRLAPRFAVRLRGDFTLDAVSPDGRRLFLIQQTSRRDLTRYAVRAYDVGARRLDPRPVVDPSEPDEPMRGLPVARAASPDGRWAYTLYDGNGTHPFVHALDTAAARARCIDLDALAGRGDLPAFRLTAGPDGSVVVREPSRGRALLVIDPRSFAVREPAAPRRAVPRPAPRDDGVPWALVLGGAALLAVLAMLVGRARRGVVESAQRAPGSSTPGVR